LVDLIQLPNGICFTGLGGGICYDAGQCLVKILLRGAGGISENTV
jgi:hypothetical protein